MTEKEIKKLSWKQKFLAARAVFESVLFERELTAPKKDKHWLGHSGILALVLIEAFFLLMWLLRQDYIFSLRDAANINIISAFMSNFSAGNWLAVFKTEILGMVSLQPPLYFISYFPVLKLFPDSLNFAITCVNSFYLAILAFSVFSLVKKTRNYQTGWLAALFACSMPCVLESLRSPSPEIAVIALTALAYASFINSEEFEKGRYWGFIYGIALAAGLFTDKFFLIYILPTIPSYIASLSSPILREKVFKGFLIAAALNIPWYLRNGFYYFSTNLFKGIEPVWFNFSSFKDIFLYLGFSAYSMHLFLFAIGFAALIWMRHAVFMPYAYKDIVFTWFFFSYACFTFLFSNSHANLYPALIPFAIAAALMTPEKFRKYLMWILGALLVINQSGFINTKSLSVFGKDIPVIGLPVPGAKKSKVSAIIDLISEKSSDNSVVKVSVIGESSDFNIPSFSFLADKKNKKNLKFSLHDSSLIGLSDFIVYKSNSFNASHKTGKFASYSSQINKKWFLKSFSKIGSYKLDDMTTARVYRKKRTARRYFKKDIHQIDKLKIGKFVFENVFLKLAGFNKSKGLYKKASIFSSSAYFGGIEIYGLKASVDNFAFIPIKKGNSVNIVPLEIGRLSVHFAEVNNYFANDENGDFAEENIKSGSIFKEVAPSEKSDKDLYVNIFLNNKKEKLSLKFSDFIYGGFKMPEFIMDILQFEYPPDRLPFKIDFKKIVFKNGIIEIS